MKPETLKPFFDSIGIEAGCDEAGRGCLAGPVTAAAVILPKDYFHPLLNDSKQVSEAHRNELRGHIEANALAWAVASVDNNKIDEINILRASFLAMHRAIVKLKITPELLLIDGNRFSPYKKIPHECIVQGDAKFAGIAAASILAKTHRDAYMQQLHKKYPMYGWAQNKGYPTELHRNAIAQHGITPYHRKTFALLPEKLLF
ncbi:ribonuclease HII [Bacteroidia bacterium]|nr:ribonuclease HII [Bacteroidia bacterium]